MCWIVTSVCICAQLPLTCCYLRLVTRAQVCIFPADWPQSASPLPAPWLAAQTEAPTHKPNRRRHETQGQNKALPSELLCSCTVDYDDKRELDVK